MITCGVCVTYHIHTMHLVKQKKVPNQQDVVDFDTYWNCGWLEGIVQINESLTRRRQRCEIHGVVGSKFLGDGNGPSMVEDIALKKWIERFPSKGQQQD